MDDNERLAVWAGFKKLLITAENKSEWPGFDCGEEVWIAPDGFLHGGALPDLLNDLNACELYLIPKLDGFIIFTGKGGIHAIVSKDRINVEGVGSKAAQALCAALDKLIGGRDG